MPDDPMSKLRAKQQKGIEAAERDRLKHPGRDPHSGAILHFGLKLIGLIILICGVAGYAIYRFMK